MVSTTSWVELALELCSALRPDIGDHLRVVTLVGRHEFHGVADVGFDELRLNSMNLPLPFAFIILTTCSSAEAAPESDVAKQKGSSKAKTGRHGSPYEVSINLSK